MSFLDISHIFGDKTSLWNCWVITRWYQGQSQRRSTDATVPWWSMIDYIQMFIQSLLSCPYYLQIVDLDISCHNPFTTITTVTHITWNNLSYFPTWYSRSNIYNFVLNFFILIIISTNYFTFIYSMYSQPCLSRICWDWRNSFDLEKIRLINEGLKTIEYKEKRTWIDLRLKCEFDLGKVDCI